VSYNPFSDLKVLDLSTVLAGPSVGMFLAELGAEVIKIEHPNHKDVTRTWKNETEKSDSISSYFSSINYKKKYISLDLGIESNREEFLSLVKNSDLLISNFKRADYIKFNITKNILFELNPSLIHGRITGYGTDSDRVAYDLILQAETGFMSINGTPESGPVKMPVALIDVLAAHHLKEGILIALYERLKTGEGREVSVSLYQAAVSSLVNQASSYLMNNTIPKRIGSLHPSIAPYGEIFITKDDRYLTFAIGNNQQFEKLMNFLKLEELAKDERFVTNQSRVIFRSLLFEKMNKTIQSIESKTIELFCLENNIPCGLIKSMDEVFQQPLSQDLIREENIDNQQTKRVSSIAFKIG
jgi:crotonobetainyl-CoA:carnitine CoA-transferase CaiB-like acyl-CoA transferase